MAWQTPKVDWSPEDGVRDDDLNRIEGNAAYLYENVTVASKAILDKNISLYVDPAAGNDSTGDGTSSKPFVTVAKALSIIPKNLSGHSVNIVLSSGSYNEALLIKGFDAPIILSGSIWSRVEFHSIRVEGCCCVVNSIELYSSGDVLVTHGGSIIGTGHMFVDGAKLTIDYNSVLSLSTVTCQNSPTFAITADHASRFYADTIVGSGNLAGLRSRGGSTISYDGSSMNVSAAFFNTFTGGRIYSGAQDSAPDY